MNDNDRNNYETIITQLDSLSDRVRSLETLNVRVDKMENILLDLDKKSAISDVVLSKVESAFNRNTEAIISIEKTLIKMQGEINSQAEITVQIKEKVGQIESKFDLSEEKSKLDFRDIFKELLKSRVLWLLGGGVFIVLMQVIIAIMNNLDKIVAVFH